MTPVLKHLTIKPTHGCALRCPYCDARRQLLQTSRDARLGIEDWARLFNQADELGTEYLDVSGGEPTCYPALPALIWEAKRHGWFVSLNTSGWGLPELLDELARVCLDQVILSLMSLVPAVHDALRCKPGSWARARDALAGLRGRPVRLVLHFILSRQNHAELPDLVDFAFAWGANGIALVYPENDGSNRHLLMSDEEIRRFRAEILPECLRRYEIHRPHPDASHKRLAGLFDPHGVDGDFAQGIYWHDREALRAHCHRPEAFALIYPNGDVLPCNSVEYTHAPIAGNILDRDLRSIWEGDVYRTFRHTRMDYCRKCPTTRHVGVAIATTDNPPYAAPVIRRVPERLPADRPAVPESWRHAWWPG